MHSESFTADLSISYRPQYGHYGTSVSVSCRVAVDYALEGVTRGSGILLERVRVVLTPQILSALAMAWCDEDAQISLCVRRSIIELPVAMQELVINKGCIVLQPAHYEQLTTEMCDLLAEAA